MREYDTVMPDEIVVGDRLRRLNPEAVEALKKSISEIGIKTPLSVRHLSPDERYELITGRHRLQVGNGAWPKVGSYSQ